MTTAADVNASSESLSFARITHCVVRHVIRTSARGTLMVCPDFDMSMTLLFTFSSSVSVNAQMTSPVFSVVAHTFTPEPPRPCSLYSSSADIFPIPFAETVRIYFALFPATHPSMRASIDATFIPRTHAAARPMTRTSFSSN